MSRFKKDAKNGHQYLPRVRKRYVDDIFAVFIPEKSRIKSLIWYLNDKGESIKFTFELEQNRKLPFLSLLVLRDMNNKLEFDIFRKK